MQFHFKARIYKTGINWCVDVPLSISKKLLKEKGYIKIKGTVNDFAFNKSLVPVKDAPYRLFVNGIMMKGGKTALGKIAHFSIEQDSSKPVTVEYPIPVLLQKALNQYKLNDAFNALTPSRKKDILRYLNMIKTEETRNRNIDKLVTRMREQSKDVRIP